MKIKTLKNRWLLPALSCAALAMTSQSKAAVVVTFNQVGTNVTATWSGSLANLGTFFKDQTAAVGSGANAFSLYVSSSGGIDRWNGSSQNTGLNGTITSFSGDFASFGFIFGGFQFEGIVDSMADRSAIDFDGRMAVMTFGNQTLAGIGAANFNNTLAWTSTAGGSNTVSYTTAVPEPSVGMVCAVSALGVALRRRRK